MAENNPQAFPTHDSMGCIYEGMTLLDYFAAKAMQGIISAPCDAVNQDVTGNARGGNTESLWDVARTSYRLAEMMLNERKKYFE